MKKKIVIKILSIFVFLAWLPKVEIEASQKVIVDTDAFVDPDDIEAFFVLRRAALEGGVDILAASTNLFYPDQKAQALRYVFTEAGFPQVPVYAGLGIYRGYESNLGTGIYPEPIQALPFPVLLTLGLYKRWPTVFGPHFDQVLNYKDIAGYAAAGQVGDSNPGLALERIAALAHVIRDNPGLTFVTLGPLTNLHALMLLHPEVIPNIDRLVIMGGWQNDESGVPKTLDYNMMMDLAATQAVLCDPRFSDLKVEIVSSHVVSNHKIYIQKNDWDEIKRKQVDNPAVQAYIKDRDRWTLHTAASKTMEHMVLTDPVAMEIALGQRKYLLERTPMSIDIFLDHDRDLKTTMFEPEARRLFKLHNAAESGSRRTFDVVTFSPEVAEQIRLSIVGDIMSYVTRGH